MKRISPTEKISYARLFAAMQASEDKEELLDYAKSMREGAAKMEARAKELDRRAQLMREQR